jgi:hypothetical protein
VSTPAQPLDVGLHHGVPAAVYHADPCPTPSLSSGVARTILARSLKHAWLEHSRLGGEKPDATAAMDLGGLVHAQLSGEEDTFQIGQFDDFKTKDARAWRDAVRLGGKTPVLEKVVLQAEPIAKAVREKAAVGITMNPFNAGAPEVTAIWKEGEAYCRARYDRLVLDPGGYADIWDWKTTESVAPDKIVRKIIDQGYHLQAAHYVRGLRALLPEYAGRMSFIFVFVETEAPYAVRRVVLSDGWLSMAGTEIHRAIGEWTNAMATNVWPEGNAETMTAQPPGWFTAKYTDAFLND